MKQKLTITALLIALLLPVLMVAQPVSAENTLTNGLGDFATNAGYDTSVAEGESGLKTQIGEIVKFFFKFLGIVMVIIFIYAGFLWMTAGGDEDKVKKAQAWMKNAVIGIIIILMAYIITDFVLSDVGDKFFGGGGGSQDSGSNDSNTGPSGAE